MHYSSVENRPLLITADFLRGVAIEDIESFLQNLANRKQKSALVLFHEAQNEKDISDILKFLVRKDDIVKYQDAYKQWLSTKQISHDLIHFLEFLALNNFHRLHFLLKRICKIKPAHNYQYVYSGLALTTCGAALAFYLRPEWWNATLDAIMVTAPNVGIWLIKYILIPQNLAVLMIGYIVVETFAKIYIILEKNSTSPEHKTNKIIRQVINCMLNVSAQIICFTSLGIISQAAASLFITAALFEMLWTLIEYCQLSEPISLTEEQKKCPLACIQYEDELAHFKRKEQQLFIAVIVLVLISIATTISVLFGGQLAFISLLSIAFQWLVSRYKDSSIENTEIEIAQNLQSKISHYHPPRSAQVDSEHLQEIKHILEENKEPAVKISEIKSLFQPPHIIPPTIKPSCA